ncbi:MAG: YhcN/YlaJ family sporulation lipoprotein [Planifilum fimeticola]
MRSVKRWALGALSVALVFGFAAGCATQQRPEETRNDALQRPARPLTNPEAVRRDAARQPMTQQMRVADKIADAIADMKRVDTATVILTDRTAYVAVMLPSGVRLTGGLEKEIVRKVRAKDASIRRVYVSANPDFVKRMGDFARDIRQGRPVAGLWDSFMDMVRRTFPHAG